MTTIAFDGSMIVADTLCVDAWGLTSTVEDKIRRGLDYYIGFAGSVHLVERYWRTVKDEGLFDVLQLGYPDYDPDKSDISIMVCNVEGNAWYMSGSAYQKVTRFSRSRGATFPYHAIGSGRDYALATMNLGYEAMTAVQTASEFDHRTGEGMVTYHLNSLRVPR
jgi:ATP-dependent protease HslVU (ClpYQ) peptidase subunit